MRGGVAALSNYDIVFTSTGDSVTADGLSVEELYQKGAGNLNAVLIIDGQTTAKPFTYNLFIEDGVTVAIFRFQIGDVISTLSIGTNGTASFMGNNATYTYSNGHYVFTPSGSGGGVTPQ